MKRNIFVIGLDEFSHRQLSSMSGAGDYNFHELLSLREVEGDGSYSLADALHAAEMRLHAFPGTIDAIIGCRNFPVTAMAPILCARFGLPGPSLESVIKCEHKYWSRVEQSRADAAHIPPFVKLDPYDEDMPAKIDLPYPFWIKAAHSAASIPSFKVCNPQDLHHALTAVRERIAAVAKPFDLALSLLEVPDDVSDVGARCCIGEAMAGGKLHTIEGHVFEGKMEMHGIIDSLTCDGPPPFLGSQYPSRLPGMIQAELVGSARRVMSRIGLDNAAFHIQYAYDPEHKRLLLLQINPGISQSHSELFRKVDGASNREVSVDLALGNRPVVPYGQGEYPVAAEFYLRRIKGAVDRPPTDEEMERIKQAAHSIAIDTHVEQGVRRSELMEASSSPLVSLYLGAENHTALLSKYRRCSKALQLGVAA